MRQRRRSALEDLEAPVSRPASITDQVTSRLRDLILNGVVGESETLTEAALGDRLGVSRTPVREALARLESEGMLEPAGLRGKRVRRFRAEEIRELFWLRRIIEGATVAEVARRSLGEGQRDRFDRLLAEQRQAGRQGDPARFLEADHGFHSAFVQALGYSSVSHMLQGLRYTFDLISLKPMYHHPNRTEEVIDEHQAVLDAVLRGDPAGAERAMTAHLDRTQTLVLAALAAEAEV